MEKIKITEAKKAPPAVPQADGATGERFGQ